MNLRKLGRMLGFVAAVAVLAMVVQGCGGGGGGDNNNLVQQDLDALQDAVDMALDGTDAMDVAEFRTMYNTLMSDYNTLMNAVSMALDGTDAMDVAAFRTMYNTLMSDYNTLMNAVSTALLDTGADTVGGFRTMYNTLMTNYNTLMDAVDMALMGIEANDVGALRTAYNTLMTNYNTLMTDYNTLMGDVDMALDTLPMTTTVQMLREAYNREMMALEGLADDVTVAMLRAAYQREKDALDMLPEGTTVAMLRAAYQREMDALAMFPEGTTVAMLGDAYNREMDALDTFPDGTTVAMLAAAYQREMDALDTFPDGTTVAMLAAAYQREMDALEGLADDVNVAMLRAAYRREMDALDGLPEGTTLADLRARAYHTDDPQANLDAREDALAILRLTGADGNEQDSSATANEEDDPDTPNTFMNDGITEAGGIDSDDPMRAPVSADAERRNVVRTIWLGCAKVDCGIEGDSPETNGDLRITRLRAASNLSVHGDVVLSGSMISFNVLEGIASDLEAAEDNDIDDAANPEVALVTTPLEDVSRIMAGNLDTYMVTDHSGWVNVRFDKDVGGGRDDEIIVFSNATEVPFGDADSKHPFNRGGVAAVTAMPMATPPVVGVSALPDSHLLVSNVADNDRFNSKTMDNTPDSDNTAGPLAVLEFTLGPNDDPTVTALTKSVNYGEFVEGTYGGIRGRFTCQPTGSALVSVGECRIRRTRTVVTENGETSTVVQVTPVMDPVDEWWFKPIGNDMVTNADYMIFGAWLTNADDPGGARAAGAFADGGVLYDRTKLNALTGNATYRGPAAGHYAERTAQEDTAASGQFTATAELTAEFGADNAPGSIVGEINGFNTRRRDGSVWVPREWLLELERETISENTAGFTTGKTSGRAGSHNWVGRWGAQFFGATQEVNMALADGDNRRSPGGAAYLVDITPTPLPSGVAGTFSASSGNPHPQTGAPGVSINPDTGIPRDDRGFVGVVGGFGAEYVAPPMMEDDS